MAEKSPRKPSTLSVARAQAAARPLGSSALVGGGLGSMSMGGTAARGPLQTSTRPQPQVFGRPAPSRPASPIAPKGSTGLSAGARPASEATASRTAPVRRADGSHEARDRWVVISVVSVFLVCVVALMSVNMVHSTQESRAREELSVSFAQAHTRQSEYRTLFGRFASFSELQERGFTLSPRQAVREWNADASHWFISIRDRQTGMVCDRTGELFDEDAAERQPVCRPLK